MRDDRNRSEVDQTAMLTIECPFCDGSLPTDTALAVVACDDCGVTLEFAPDPIALDILAAAA